MPLYQDTVEVREIRRHRDVQPRYEICAEDHLGDLHVTLRVQDPDQVPNISQNLRITIEIV